MSQSRPRIRPQLLLMYICTLVDAMSIRPHMYHQRTYFSGPYVPRTMRPWDDVFLGQCVSRTMCHGPAGPYTGGG